MCSADIFLGLLALLFPPLPVWVKCGICSADSLINILLCMLGYIPGLLHSWYIIAKYPEPDYEYERLGGHDAERVTYVFVAGQPHRQQAPKPSHDGGNRTYGTTGNGQQQQPQSGNQAGPSSAGPAPQQPQPQQGPAAGEGSSDGAPPPSYAAVVAGDHKVQTQE